MGVFPECCFQGRETQADQSALAASLVRFSRMFRCLDVHGAEPFICSRCAISCRIVPSVLVRIIVAELLPWNCSPMQAQKRATQLDPALPTSIQSSEHRLNSVSAWISGASAGFRLPRSAATG